MYNQPSFALTPIDLILKRYGPVGSGFPLLIFVPAQSF